MINRGFARCRRHARVSVRIVIFRTVIHTGVWFLGKDALLAPEWIERISHERTEVFVNLPRSAIKDAPEYDAGAPLGRAFEQRLHDHYSRKGYWDAVEAARKP